MIVRSKDEVRNGKGHIIGLDWESFRFLHEADGVGFTMTDTFIQAGADQLLHYQNHVEAVYIIEGTGHILDLTTNERHELRPGVFYALNDHDKHRLRTETTLRCICVFNPPLKGGEIHDSDGNYA
ncbi:hypothetical protein B6S59_31710 [Pseudomonas sp. A46]|nr:hypothetical protein B6S59_31710 [Pseudomonas sp. A46]